MKKLEGCCAFFWLSAFSALSVMSQAVYSKIKVPKYLLCLKCTTCFSGCLWGWLDVMDCEPLHTNQSISCFFASLSWLVTVAYGVPNLVRLFICHALFYKVNELRFLEEPGISVKWLYLWAHRWWVVLKEVFIISPEWRLWIVYKSQQLVFMEWATCDPL